MMSVVLHLTALQLMVIATISGAQRRWYCPPAANTSYCANVSSYVDCGGAGYNISSLCKAYSCNSLSSGCSCRIGVYNCSGGCNYENTPDFCNCDTGSQSCYCLRDLKPENGNIVQNKTAAVIVNILDQIANMTNQMSPSMAEDYLKVVDAVQKVIKSEDKATSVSYGNAYINVFENLVSALVTPTDNYTLKDVVLSNTEVRVLVIGPNAPAGQIPPITTKDANMDIDLYEIAMSSPSKSASLTFVSFNEVGDLLKANFFNSSNDTINTMMSKVISATLPNTTNSQLTKPVNFTFRHIEEWDPSGSLSCVYWNISEWIVDGCSVVETNSSSTVCSCVHLSTFALIMQTRPLTEDDWLLDLLGLVCVIVGLLFLSLALLTFALCQWSPGVNNVARINICISLLSAHLLFLLTQKYLTLIRPKQVLCAVISGLLHFLFLSAFVWMFIEAVLLFICVSNLSQISSKKREVLNSGFLCVIGYVVSLVVVAVSVGLVPDGYGSEKCWIRVDFIWSFLGPVSVILALNFILFIRIVINLNTTLKKLNAEVSQMKQTKIMAFKTLAQFVVLGCPWIMGFFINSCKMLEIPFLILNSQQGTFIFLIYCVLNKEIMKQYKNFFRSLYSGLKQHGYIMFKK